MAEAFVALAREGVIDENLAERMCKATGFRNIVIHEYEKINWAIVYSIATKGLDDFRLFAKAVDSLVSS